MTPLAGGFARESRKKHTPSADKSAIIAAMTRLGWVSALIALGVSTACSGSDEDGAGGAGGTPAHMGVKVAFLGDQGLGPPTEAALALVLEEQADLLVILGDFDYEDDPPAWQTTLDTALGSNFPLFAVIGNHDVDAWTGYQPIIQQKLAANPDATCTGEPGVQMSCVYKGIRFVLTGVGTYGDGHEAFMESELASATETWKICGWHKNQRQMQVGDKGDEVGWEAYRACMMGGAIITTGHEHSYGRTRTMTDIGNTAGQHGATGPNDSVEVAPGKTFVVVSGMGGASLRAYDPTLHDGEAWWATMYTNDWILKDGVGQSGSNLLTPSGALFVTFGVDDDPKKARAEFKVVGIDPATVDEFEIVTE